MHLFASNYPNNEKWDMQVGHGLPGQIPIINSEGQPMRDNQGYIKTRDQYAIYNNKVVRAGYLSNYAYGYSSAAAGLPQVITTTIAQGIAVKAGKDGDNPQDIIAIQDGWKAYWQKNK